MTPILARSMTWVELPGGTSIVFDLRIAAVAGESEAETNNRFVAEAIRIAGSFLLELGPLNKPEAQEREALGCRNWSSGHHLRYISHAKCKA